MCQPIMDHLLALKPLFTSLALPIGLCLFWLMAMLLWIWRHTAGTRRSRIRVAAGLSLLACVTLWLLSCQAVAVWLSEHALPQVVPITPAQLQSQRVQAIVVLGGGVEPLAPEYGQPSLQPEAMTRLLYGVYLAQVTHLPMAYSGGVGWAGQSQQATEADVASLVLQRLHEPDLRWKETASRDTHENAKLTAALLQQAGITRVALVTHAWHMPRSLRHFQLAGLDVVPAPTGYIHSDQHWPLPWLPSAKGLRDSTWVLREWLALRLGA